MVTLFAVCTIAPSSAAGVKPPIPDIDADDIGAATIVLATCNRLYRLALPTSNRPSHRRCNHQLSINALADSVATTAIITTTPLLDAKITTTAPHSPMPRSPARQQQRQHQQSAVQSVEMATAEHCFPMLLPLLLIMRCTLPSSRGRLDLHAPRNDIYEALATSNPKRPADYGHYGPWMI